MAFATRRVGTTSLNVTTLGLGGATLAGNIEPVSVAAARLLVVDAYDNGLRYFDTSPFYGYGRSEHLMGDELRDRKDWVLSTKVGRVLSPRKHPQDARDKWRDPFPFEPRFDYSYDGVMRSYEDSLQRLGLDRIDILYLHDVDVWSHSGSKETQSRYFRTAMEGGYKALDQLRSAGDIKGIGLGVNDAQPIGEALDHGKWDVFLLAGRYTLLEQGPVRDVLPAVKKHGASIVIGGPFNSGVLVGGDTFNYDTAPAEVVARVKRIEKVCNAHGVPMPAAALQFPLANDVVASVIPGPRSAEELNQILDWWRVKIPASLWSDLKNEGVLDRDTPTPA
jgi:D-threo-aldose 1-dehydrogenase